MRIDSCDSDNPNGVALHPKGLVVSTEPIDSSAPNVLTFPSDEVVVPVGSEVSLNASPAIPVPSIAYRSTSTVLGQMLKGLMKWLRFLCCRGAKESPDVERACAGADKATGRSHDQYDWRTVGKKPKQQPTAYYIYSDGAAQNTGLFDRGAGVGVVIKRSNRDSLDDISYSFYANISGYCGKNVGQLQMRNGGVADRWDPSKVETHAATMALEFLRKQTLNTGPYTVDLYMDSAETLFHLDSYVNNPAAWPNHNENWNEMKSDIENLNHVASRFPSGVRFHWIARNSNQPHQLADALAKRGRKNSKTTDSLTPDHNSKTAPRISDVTVQARAHNQPDVDWPHRTALVRAIDLEAQGFICNP